MEFQSGVNNNMLSELLVSPEKNKNDDEELEIERKYYEKPNMATDPQQAANFLQGFIQGMM